MIQTSGSMLKRFFAVAAARPKITSRNSNFSLWYQDVIAAADLIDSAPVKGTVILKPAGYGIWEHIQRVSTVVRRPNTSLLL